MIVSGADSGLDYSHCFFRDPNHPKPGPNHRKVIDYQGKGSHYGLNPCHLTLVPVCLCSHSKQRRKRWVGRPWNSRYCCHRLRAVCCWPLLMTTGAAVFGSVTGKAIGDDERAQRTGEYDGMAPEARLVFQDIGRGHQVPSYFITAFAGLPQKIGFALQLGVPDELGSQLFAKAYKTGARIHTNSWGCQVCRTLPIDCFLSCTALASSVSTMIRATRTHAIHTPHKRVISTALCGSTGIFSFCLRQEMMVETAWVREPVRVKVKEQNLIPLCLCDFCLQHSRKVLEAPPPPKTACRSARHRTHTPASCRVWTTMIGASENRRPRSRWACKTWIAARRSDRFVTTAANRPFEARSKAIRRSYPHFDTSSFACD
jgi:hypothetical protein